MNFHKKNREQFLRKEWKEYQKWLNWWSKKLRKMPNLSQINFAEYFRSSSWKLQGNLDIFLVHAHNLIQIYLKKLVVIWVSLGLIIVQLLGLFCFWDFWSQLSFHQTSMGYVKNYHHMPELHWFTLAR